MFSRGKRRTQSECFQSAQIFLVCHFPMLTDTSGFVRMAGTERQVMWFDGQSPPSCWKLFAELSEPFPGGIIASGRPVDSQTTLFQAIGFTQTGPLRCDQFQNPFRSETQAPVKTCIQMSVKCCGIGRISNSGLCRYPGCQVSRAAVSTLLFWCLRISPALFLVGSVQAAIAVHFRVSNLTVLPVLALMSIHFLTRTRSEVQPPRFTGPASS